MTYAERGPYLNHTHVQSCVQWARSSTFRVPRSELALLPTAFCLSSHFDKLRAGSASRSALPTPRSALALAPRIPSFYTLFGLGMQTTNTHGRSRQLGRRPILQTVEGMRLSTHRPSRNSRLPRCHDSKGADFRKLFQPIFTSLLGGKYTSFALLVCRHHERRRGRLVGQVFNLP
jgi:hypothetical protein